MWRVRCRQKLRPAANVTKLFRKEKLEGPLVLSGVTLHLLSETHENVSATQIRAAAEKAQLSSGWYPKLWQMTSRRKGCIKAGDSGYG